MSENVDSQVGSRLTAYSQQEGKSSQCRGGRKICGQKRKKKENEASCRVKLLVKLARLVSV